MFVDAKNQQQHFYNEREKAMKKYAPLLTVTLVFMTGLPALAVSLGQVDDFEDGTLMDWAGGSVANGELSNNPDGGPLGAGDNFLEFKRSNPFHVGVKNEDQWSGDYASLGIAALNMDLNHISGTTPLGIRIVVFGPGGAFTSIDPTPISQGWNNYTFLLDSANMMFLDGSSANWPGGGTELLSDTMEDVIILLIRNDPGPTPTPVGSHPPHITATLGVDNVQPAVCGDLLHPYPVGDLNEDCDVNLLDLALMSLHWLECTHPNGCN